TPDDRRRAAEDRRPVDVAHVAGTPERRDRVFGSPAIGVLATFGASSNAGTVLDSKHSRHRRSRLHVRKRGVADATFGFDDFFDDFAAAGAAHDCGGTFIARPEGVRLFFRRADFLEFTPFHFFAFHFAWQVAGVDQREEILELERRAGAFGANDARDGF